MMSKLADKWPLFMLRPLFIITERPFIAYGLTVMIAATIIILSLSPLEALPPAPGSDKLQHFIAYGALAMPLSFIYARHLRWYLISFILLGGLIELVQPFVNRYGEWADFGANMAGVMLGYMVGRIVFKGMQRLAM